jgi:hypothetical protein
MDHHFAEEDEISLYHAQFAGNEFIDWETAVLERSDDRRRRLARITLDGYETDEQETQSLWSTTVDY